MDLRPTELKPLKALGGGKRWRVWRIIEQLHGGKSITGTVEYGGDDVGGAFGVGWKQEGGGNRTTVFQPASWRRETVLAGMTFFDRIAEDTADFNVPRPDAFRYAIIPMVVEEKA